jgi:hypothetical protein
MCMNISMPLASRVEYKNLAYTAGSRPGLVALHADRSTRAIDGFGATEAVGRVRRPIELGDWPDVSLLVVGGG